MTNRGRNFTASQTSTLPTTMPKNNDGKYTSRVSNINSDNSTTPSRRKIQAERKYGNIMKTCTDVSFISTYIFIVEISNENTLSKASLPQIVRCWYLTEYLLWTIDSHTVRHTYFFLLHCVYRKTNWSTFTHFDRFSSSFISSKRSMSIHSGGTRRHFCCFLKCTPNQRGTWTGIPARNGPTLPDIRCNGSNEKFGITPIMDFSPMNSITQGSIFVAIDITSFYRITFYRPIRFCTFTWIDFPGIIR